MLEELLETGSYNDLAFQRTPRRDTQSFRWFCRVVYRLHDLFSVDFMKQARCRSRSTFISAFNFTDIRFCRVRGADAYFRNIAARIPLARSASPTALRLAAAALVSTFAFPFYKLVPPISSM